eukprot:scaffold1130_cov195-Pinguiococcus_pyrenoidosus.AAC.51
MPGHIANTTVAKFSPSGFWVCSADETGKIMVWSWDNPEHIVKYEGVLMAGKVTDLEWGPESKRITISGEVRRRLICRSTDTRLWEGDS